MKRYVSVEPRIEPARKVLATSALSAGLATLHEASPARGDSPVSPEPHGIVVVSSLRFRSYALRTQDQLRLALARADVKNRRVGFVRSKSRLRLATSTTTTGTGMSATSRSSVVRRSVLATI
jgi:hypothetical protein